MAPPLAPAQLTLDGWGGAAMMGAATWKSLEAGAAGDISVASTSGGSYRPGAGAAVENRDKSSPMLRERGRFKPARYFVDEVISGFDETDLYKT